MSACAFLEVDIVDTGKISFFDFYSNNRLIPWYQSQGVNTKPKQNLMIDVILGLQLSWKGNIL